MARARELGSPRPLVSTLVAVGEHRWKLGDLVPARALCEECLRLASAIGLGTYQAVAHHNLAEVCAQQDDWPGALVHSDAAYRIYAANGQPSQANLVPVSYTHLDVYKRQVHWRIPLHQVQLELHAGQNHQQR